MKNNPYKHRIRGKGLLALAGACLGLAGGAHPVAADTARVLPGHVPADVAQSLPTSHLNVSSLRLAIALPPRNQGQLDQLVKDLYDPSSPNFHHYLSVKDYTAKFGPSESDYEAVERYIASKGLKVVDTSPTHMVLDVAGPVASVEKAFNVKELVYTRLDGSTFYAPDVDPSVPESLPAITAIDGLDNAHPPQPASGPGTGIDGAYDSSDLRTAYNIPANLTGTGQTVALLDEGGFQASDVSTYESQYGISVPVQGVSVDGMDPSVLILHPGYSFEAALDIDTVVSVAPGLSKVLVYCGETVVDIFSKVASDDLASVFSISLAEEPEASVVQAQNALCEQMAAQGISVLAGSGDWGAWGTGGEADDTDPASEPFVTGVGGTSLTTNGPGGAWLSEVTWNAGGDSSGGGYESAWPIPWYQVGTANLASTAYRNGPDVAADADQTYGGVSEYFYGAWGISGGTSAASPFWAGVIAEVNQQRAQNGLGPIGFLNPPIYAIGNGPNYATDFHDITSGTNGTYSAGVGYDNVTGWGSPNGANLIAALASDSAVSAGDQVNLGAIANVYGIYTDETSFATGGIGGGYAYSEQQLGSVVNWNGTDFNILPPNVPDAVSSETVALPAGQFSSIKIIGGADNGDQASQTFTVTYSDNSTQTFTQGISDWGTYSDNTGETVVSTLAYRDYDNGTIPATTTNLYGYTFALNSAKTVASITLPSNANVFVLGMSLLGGSLPSTPVGLTPIAGNDQVALTWVAGAGDTSYNIYRGTTSGGEVTTAIATGVTTRSYTDSGVTNGVTYYYNMAGVNAAGTSTRSNEAQATPGVTAPATPTGVTATGSTTSPDIPITWNAVSGATIYYVYRGLSSGGENYAPWGTVTAPTTTYTDLESPGTVYYYKVAAANSVGISAHSSEVSAYSGLVAPTGFTAVAGSNDQVNLSWTAVAGATGYALYRSTFSGGELEQSAYLSGITATSISDTNVTVGTTYYYVVAAQNALGIGLPSSEQSAVPVISAPVLNTPTAGNSQIALTWAAVPGASFYYVYRATTSGAENNDPSPFFSNTNSYTDTGLTNGVTYYYTARTVSSNNVESAMSGEVSGTPVNSGPAAPTGLTATPGNAQVALSWNPTGGATSYNVYSSTAEGGEGTTPIATGITTSSYTNTGLTNGTSYFYKVAAVNAQGTSPVSYEGSATPVASPAAPVIEIASGSTAATGGFLADTDYSGGASSTWGGTINTSLLLGTIPAQAVLQEDREGASFTYTTPGLTASTPYNVTLYFVEQTVNTVGGRVFSVTANGVTLLSNLDVYATAGADDTAIEYTAPVYASSTGVIGLTFTGLVNQAKCSAIVISPSGPTGPPVPTGLTITALSGILEVGWTAAPSASSWIVYRGTSPGGESTSGISYTLAPAYISGLTNGTTYYFKVAAVNSTGISALSSEISGTPNPAPATPTGLSVTSGNTQLILSWTASARAATYDVYRGTASGGENGAAVKTGITTTTYTDTGLTNGTTYFYKVDAHNGAGYSNESTEASNTPTGTLAAPTGLGVTVGNTQLTLSWTASTGATSYNVYRGTATGAESATAVATAITTTGYTDTGLTNGVTYYYEVAAVNSTGSSPLSTEAYGTPNAAPAAPTGLGVATGNAQLTLSWTASTGATSYNVYRGTATGAESGTAVGTSTTAGYTDTGLTNGTTYFYKVSAVNSAGTSAQSTEAFNTPNGVPAAPTGLGVATGNTQLTLSWTASTGATSYNVYRGTATGAESGTAVGTSTTAGYTDTGLTNGTTYFYKVAAVNTVGTSAQSTEASNTPNAVPAAPTGLGITIGNTQLTLAWTASSGATSYNVYRGTATGGESATAIGTSTTAGYTDTGLTNGTAYFYKVAAVNNAGTSAQSAEASNTPNAVPAAPTGLGITVGNTQLTLAWTASTGATSYNVYRGTATGGESATAIGTSTTAGYTDTGLTNGTTYFYKVAAVNNAGTSAQSTEQSAAPTAGSGSPILQIACGGTAAIGSFVADTDFTNGGDNNWGGTINTTLLTGTIPPQGVLQEDREAGNFTYTLPGLTANAAYNVTLYFVEQYFNTVGSRVFSVTANGTTVINNLDIYATAGADDKAIEETFTVNASSAGVITLVFNASANQAKCSAIVIASGGPTAPAAPTGLTPTAGNASVSLNWNASSGATSYNVYRATATGGEGTTAYATGLTATSYSDTAVTNGTTYFYTVAAVNAVGASSQSTEVSATPVAPPAAPTGLTPTAGNTQVSLSWNASSTATSYNVYRGTAAGGESTTAVATGITVTTYIDTGLTNGTAYFYKVSAVNASGTSGLSTEVTSTPQASIPTAPTGLTPSAGNAQVSLTWTSSTGATAYNVYRGTATGGESATAVATGVTTTSYTDTGLTNGTTYFYKVAAVNTAGTSTLSTEVSAAPSNGPTIEIASGSTAVTGGFLADTDFSGGGANNWGSAINTSLLTGSIPAQSVLQEDREGGAFTYTIPGFVANSSHSVTLYFVEQYFNTAGSRVFSVSANGTTVIANLDVYATAGADDKAIENTFTTSASSTGVITLAFTASVNQAKCSAIVIY
ncbi:MAG: fibronectin type III domain-containing protein [Capsulimonadaceae bacterium]